MCKTFRENDWRDPSIDDGNHQAVCLKDQLRGYGASNPETIHQKDLPLLVYRTIWTNWTTLKDVAPGQIIVSALFFGMRSCEYSEVVGDRKTKILLVENIQFFHHRREIKKSFANLPLLPFASSVSVTFVRQKTDKHYATITQHASGRVICPVQSFAQIVTRVLSYTSATMQSKIIMYVGKHGDVEYIPAVEVATHLKDTVTSIGESVLGFDSTHVGTHSNRTSFAMMLYLM